MTFKSKVDAWLVVLLTAALLLAPVMVLTHWGSPRHPPMSDGVFVIVALVSVVPPTALVTWMFRTTDYTLTDTDLLVRSGPVNIKVPLASVRKIAATHSILSAPALSLDRLEITYGKYNSVVISPDDKQAFVNEMIRRFPDIVVAGIAPKSG